jgi:hypothetical protein
VGYTPQTWHDSPATDTPISAARLTNIENGVAAIANLPDAKGDVIVASAADTLARLPVGADGQVLTASSGAATGVTWATFSGSGSTATTLSLMTGAAPSPGVWLDGRMPSGTGSAPPADGASVGTWSDTSGNSRDASQATGANQPAFNASATSMTWTSSKHMSVTYPGVVMRQYYVVAKVGTYPGSGAYMSLVGGTAAGQLNLRLNGPSASPALQLNIDNTIALATLNYTPGTADFHVYSFSYVNTGTWKVRVDGSQLSSGTGATAIGSSLAIRIGNDSSGTAGWQGQIATVLAYSAIHDDATCYRIEKFLAGAYGATFPGL